MREVKAVTSLGGGDPSGAFGMDAPIVRDALASLLQHRGLTQELAKVTAEWTKVTLGLSDIEIDDRDSRFADGSWRQNPMYRRLAQSYLAWAQSVDRLIHDDELDWHSQRRLQYVANIVTGALSPTNFVLTNPAAIKQAIDTAGLSLVRGARNFLHDVVTNKGMPSMVDATPFKVGVNLAISPGAVVYREEMFELIQYSPTTDAVHERPLLFVPPQVSRYYIMDLAPGRSLVEYAVGLGMQSFMIVWRNPRKDPRLGHGKWGFDAYVAAVIRAFGVVKDISGSEDLNLLGFCMGGMTSALAQAHLAASGTSPVHSATYLVTMLDARKPNMITTLASDGANSALDVRAGKGDVLDAKAVSHNFAWMRPQDLVYGNLVHNWLMGESPSQFDLLAWNEDGANVSSSLTRDSTRMLARGDLVQPGTATVLGTPIDLSSVKADNFIVAAQADHITTWAPVYMTSQVLGGDSEMVLINKGHIQTVVSPIPKSRHKYWAGPATGPDPEEWRDQAEQHEGSWWPHWASWLAPRAGRQQPATQQLGAVKYPQLAAAPGTYVHEV